jgi:hypothetical protein
MQISRLLERRRIIPKNGLKRRATGLFGFAKIGVPMPRKGSPSTQQERLGLLDVELGSYPASFVCAQRAAISRHHKRARSINWRTFQPKAVARLQLCLYRVLSVG